MRTRSGKGKVSESVTPAPQTNLDSNQNDPSSSNSSRASGKLARSFSNNSMHSQIYVGGKQPVVAFYSKPTLTISGLPDDFIGKLEREEDFGKPKTLYEQFKEIERTSSSQEPVDPSQTGNDHDRPKRGGRGRSVKVQKRISPKKRRTRHQKTLTDVDEETASRPASPSVGSENEANADNSGLSGEPTQELVEQDQDENEQDDALSSPAQPDASPSQQLINETVDAVGTNEEPGPTEPWPAAEPKARPTYLDEELGDADLPPPFASNTGSPPESDIEDQADFIVKTRFGLMTDPQKFITALTKHAPSARGTQALYALAENTQAALKAWQDEFLTIDKRVAVHANNGPRKPVNGGRVTIDSKIFDDQKEADIYSYVYDGRKPPGTQDPFGQRIGTDYVGGRELRHRRARDVTADDLAASEEEVGKRKRRTVQRFETTADAGSRTRKRDVAASETPEPPGPRKRGKFGSASKRQAYVPARIREMRGESAMTTSASEDDDTYDGTPEPRGKRRGRPPGSKNLAQRKDAGIKKGPRGKKSAAQAAANAANATNTINNDQSNGTLATFTSAAGGVPGAPAYQQPQQQQPFVVHGYHHTPPASIPPASMAPMAGLNLDASYMTSHPYPQQHPFSPAIALESPVTPVASAQRNGHPQPGPTSAVATPPAPLTTSPNSVNSHTAASTSSGRKKGVKSEKRSASMTQWWAERKARQAEARLADQQRAAASNTTANAAAVSHNAQPTYGASINGYTGPYPPTQGQPSYPSQRGTYGGTPPAQHQQSATFRAIAPDPHGQGQTQHQQAQQQAQHQPAQQQTMHQQAQQQTTHQQAQQQAQQQTRHHHHHTPQSTHHHQAPLPSAQHGHQAHQHQYHGPFGFDGAGSPPPPIQGSVQEGVPDSVRRDILGLRGRPEPRRGL